MHIALIARCHSPRRTQGSALIVTLLLLTIFTMFAISSFTSSTTNLRVTGNMMVRKEATAAAYSVVEQIISNTTFTADPLAVAASTYPVDINGNGSTDYIARISPAPSCQKVRIVKLSELNIDRPADKQCISSSKAEQTNIDDASVTAATGNSLCAATEWNIRSVVTDQQTGASVAVNEGFGVLALKTDADDLCK